MAQLGGRLEGRVTVPSGGWTATVGGGTATIAAGDYFPDELLDAVGVAFAAAASTTCTASASLSSGGTGLTTIAFGASKAITWVSTDLRDILGFTGNLSAATSHVGTQHLRATWLPGCPYNAPNDISADWAGELEADVRSMTNHSGYVWTHVGQQKVVTWLEWQAVAISKTWAAHETTVNASFERFARDCMWGVPSWGHAGGPIRFYPDASDDAVYVEYMVADLESIDPQPLTEDAESCAWTIHLPRLVQVPPPPEAPWMLPGDATEWAETFPDIAVPTSIWPMQDSGDPLVDTVGTYDLANPGGGGAVTIGETGEDPLGRLSVFFEAISSRRRLAATGDMDLTTGDLTVFFRFHVDAAETPASGHYFFRKRSITANTNGWAVKFVGTSGHIELVFDTPSDVTANAEITEDHDDDAWHYCMAVVDRTAAEIRIYTDLGSASLDISGHAGGSATNSVYFGIGDTQTNANACAIVRYSYAAAWMGTALTEANFDEMRNAA